MIRCSTVFRSVILGCPKIVLSSSAVAKRGKREMALSTSRSSGFSSSKRLSIIPVAFADICFVFPLCSISFKISVKKSAFPPDF